MNAAVYFGHFLMIIVPALLWKCIGLPAEKWESYYTLIGASATSCKYLDFLLGGQKNTEEVHGALRNITIKIETT